MEENIKQPLKAVSQVDSIISQNDYESKITNKKDSFILFNEQIEVFEALTDEQAGKLIKAIYKYTNNKPFELSELLKVVFIPIRQQIDRNSEKYEIIKQKRKIAGAKGGKQKVANATFAKQIQANQAVNDNVNVNDNVIYKEKINKKESEKIPTKEEIKKYCEERKNNIDAEQFYDYYSSKGWMIGKNRMKDFKAAIRQWERNTKTFNNSNTQKGEFDGWSL